jgi:hypothetical protein
MSGSISIGFDDFAGFSFTSDRVRTFWRDRFWRETGKVA